MTHAISRVWAELERLTIAPLTTGDQEQLMASAGKIIAATA